LGYLSGNWLESVQEMVIMPTKFFAKKYNRDNKKEEIYADFNIMTNFEKSPKKLFSKK
jgi:hypothetical protein